MIVWFGLVEGKTLKSYILTSTIDETYLRFAVEGGCGGGDIVQSKIQVTPTQVALELKFSCDNFSFWIGCYLTNKLLLDVETLSAFLCPCSVHTKISLRREKMNFTSLQIFLDER